jgi:hypothetical protein
MSTLPAKSYLSSGTSRTEGEVKTNYFDKILDVLAELPGGAESVPEYTISSGAIVPAVAVFTVDTESDAASDDLTNITTTNMPEGRIVFFRAANAARTVVVKHESGGAGQISTAEGNDITLDDAAKWVVAVRNGADWEVVSVTSTSSYIQADLFGTRILSGLAISNNSTDADYDIDVATGSCIATDGSNYKVFTLSSGLTKQIDANWSVGNNAGGFPSGLSLTAETMYRVFLIGKSDGTIDAGFDTSSSAANLLSDATGYTFYKHLGWICYYGDALYKIRSFWHNAAGRFFFNDIITDISNTSGTLGTWETGSVLAPPNTLTKFTLRGEGSSCSHLYAHIRDTIDYVSYTSAYFYNDGGTGYCKARGEIDVKTDSDSQIGYRLYASGGGAEAWEQIIIWVRGWYDTERVYGE